MNRHAAVLLGVAAAVFWPASLHAQCADGTPPPCDVRTAQLGGRLAVTPPPASERGRRFLVLPFRNVTGGAGQQWLVEGSPTLLGDALGKWREVSVVPARRLFEALRRQGLTPGDVMDEARVRRVVDETGGWTVVEGDVLAVGGRVRLRAQAYDAATGSVLVVATEEARSEDEIFTAYERLAEKLLESAGLSAPAGMSEVATSSLDAYKAYLRGIAHDNRSESARALAAFLDAVRLDSAFAQAWARAASASLISLELFTDQEQTGRRYAARAAALASRLPQRERTLVEAINALHNGQFAAGRSVLNGMIAADSSDLEALRLLAQVEAWDLILDPGTGWPRGSFNRAARLAKRGLALDPTRHGFYSILMFSYAVPAGLWGGMVPSWAREHSSPRAMFTSFPGKTFVGLMRDTIELVPTDVLDTLPAEVVRASRQRAVEAAQAWVDRWLAAGPAEAEAHLWASRMHELGGRLEEALSAVRRADSLGIESGWDEPVARGMVLRAKLGRYDEALRIADSLLDAGYFANTAELISAPGAFERAGWALMLFLHDGRLERAEAAIAPLLAAAKALVGPMVDAIAPAYLCGDAVAVGLSPVDLPLSFRREVAKRVLGYAPRMPPIGFVPQCVVALMQTAASSAASPDETAELFAAAHATVGMAVDSGNADFAVTMAITLVNADTTVGGRLMTLEALERVVAADSGNLRAMYQVGKIGALTGRELGRAQAALEVYLRHAPAAGEPTHADAHWRLGMIQEHRGDLDAARAGYRKALGINPRHPQASEALARLGGATRQP